MPACATPAAELGVPTTVRDVVSQRLARLPDAGEDGARARGGRRAPSSSSTRSARRRVVHEPALLDAIDEAVRSGLLVEQPGRGLAYRFAHELVRRAVEDRLSAARKAEIHLRVAEALEHGWSAGDSRAVLAALAHHYAAGVGGRRRRPRRRLQRPRRRVGGRRTRVRRGGGPLPDGTRARRPRPARASASDAPARRRVPSRRARGRGARGVLADGRARPDARRRRAPRAGRDRLRGGVLAPGDPRRAARSSCSTRRPPRFRTTTPRSVRSALGGLARALDLRGESGRAGVARDASIAMSRRRGDRADARRDARHLLLVARQLDERGRQRGCCSRRSSSARSWTTSRSRARRSRGSSRRTSSSATTTLPATRSPSSSSSRGG